MDNVLVLEGYELQLSGQAVIKGDDDTGTVALIWHIKIFGGPPCRRGLTGI